MADIEDTIRRLDCVTRTASANFPADTTVVVSTKGKVGEAEIRLPHYELQKVLDFARAKLSEPDHA